MAAILVGLAPLLIALDSGGVLPWTQWAAATAALVAVALAIPAAWARQRATGFRPHAIALLILIAAGFALFQMQALPTSVLRLASPGSRAVYTQWLAPLSEPAVDSLPPLKRSPVSLAPWQTGGVAALLVLVAAYAWVASTVFTSRQRIAWLLTVLLTAGALHAGLGFYQQIAHPTLNAWGYAGRGGGAPFGMFINRNNAAALINIGLGCSLGLFAWRLAALTGHQLAGAPVPADAVIDLLTDRTAVTAILGGLVCFGGLLASGSRGGLAGGIAGAALAMGLVARIRRGRALPTGAIALGLIAAVLLVRFELPHATLDRLGATGEGLSRSVVSDGRLDHWPDAFRAGMAYLPAGAGAGTYRYAYLPYQTTSSSGWFVNADNLWLEWFVEMGAVGVVLLVLALLFIGHALVAVNSSPDPLDHGLATAGWFALGALCVTQLFDFGLTLPPTAIAAAVLFSAVVARSRSLFSEANLLPHWARTIMLLPRRRRAIQGRAARFAEMINHRGAVAVALVLLAVALWQAQSASARRAVSDNLQRHQQALIQRADATPADWDRLIDDFDKHLAGAATDYVAHTRASEAKLLRARLTAALAGAVTPEEVARRYGALSLQRQRSTWYERKPASGVRYPVSGIRYETNGVRSPVAGSRDLEIGNLPPEIGNRIPATGYRIPAPDFSFVAFQSATTGNEATDADLQLPPDVLGELRGHAIAALLAAPLADEPRYTLALLDFAGGSPEQSRELLVQLASLRRQNAPSLHQIATAAAVGQMWDVAGSVWRRTIQISPNYASTVLARIADVPQLPPHKVIPPTPDALAIAVRHNLRAGEPDELLLDAAVRVLTSEVQRPLENDGAIGEGRARRIGILQVLAQIQTHRGDASAAAELHSQIVRLTPTDPPALYAYAVALAAAGDDEAARSQARKGRQLAPEDARFDALLQKIAREEANRIPDRRPSS